MNPDTSLEIEKLKSEWLDYLKLEKQYSNYSIIAYKIDLEYFIEWLTNHLNIQINIDVINRMNLSDFRTWLSFRKEQDLSASSSRRAISTIKSFFKYLKRYNIFNNSVLDNIRLPRKSQVLPKALIEEDSLAAIEYITRLSSLDWIGVRDQTILTIMYGCGLRISEVLNLTKKDITTEYLIILGKGKKERLIPILDLVRQSIDRYLSVCPYTIQIDDKIFIGKQGKSLNPGVFQRQVRKVRIELGLKDETTPHAFRHGFASDILINGGDLRSIQELLGHESLSTTQRYTKIDHKKLFEVYNLSHPRAKNNQV